MIRHVAHMVRLPDCPVDDCMTNWMRHDIDAFVEEHSLSQVNILKDVVEVIDASNGMRKAGSIPTLQVRAKATIQIGGIRLFPHNGVVVPEQAMSQRNPLEHRLKALPDCYMKGVKFSVISRSRGHASQRDAHQQNFLMFSPCGGKELVTSSGGASDSSRVGYIAPFWALLMTDRDKDDLVNTLPCTDENTLPHPVGKHYNVGFACGLKVIHTFVTNSKELHAGDLLVLPYDGGTAQIFSVPPRMCPTRPSD